MIKTKEIIHQRRFEFLLAALLMLLFNRFVFQDTWLYLTFIWPANMILLGIVSVGIFKERSRWIQIVKNILFVFSVIVPLVFEQILQSKLLSGLGIGVYIVYYSLIFSEVIRQIVNPKEFTTSIILGSICGYLLLMVVALFSNLLLEFFVPGSFNGITSGNIPAMYNELSYFSMITLSTIGYGDITPASDQARLLAGFFGTAGQFYMVTLVGIIIAKFTSK